MPSAEVDLGDALAWVEDVAGPVAEVRPLTGGWTSTMLALTAGEGARRRELVLRLMTREPWRTHGEGLTTRERDVQRMLAATPVPAPRTVALDPTGERCGHPAHLMTLLPGRVEEQRTGTDDLTELARVLADVHAVEPTTEVRPFQSWAWEAKHVVPTWSREPAVWEDAFALLREEPPVWEATFLHRDFQPRNVLWDDERVSGVVDWVETSVGPAWLDVAHCATNLALWSGPGPALAFRRAYAEATGREPIAWVDVMDVVGFLPPPGKPGFFDDRVEVWRRLEDWLRVVLPSSSSGGRAAVSDPGTP